MWNHKNKISIYLATPYTNKNKMIMNFRYIFVNYAASLLMDKPYEFVVFSPITHCHEIALNHKLPTTWDFWSAYDFYFIDVLNEVWVFMQDGWKESVGVQAEIDYARKNNKPIVYFNVNQDNDKIIIYSYEGNPMSLQNFKFNYELSKEEEL